MSARERLKKITSGKKIWCYGAGNYGKTVAYALLNIGADLKGFIVTSKEGCRDTVLHKPVYELASLTIGKDDRILICVNTMLQMEMEEELKKKGIKDYYFIAEEDIEELDRTIEFNLEVSTDRYVNVLLYHRVCEMKNDIWNIAVTPDEFEKQMLYIKNNYKILKFEDDWSNVKDKAVVITFDDGYLDNYLYAVPILKKYNIPATIFVSTDNIGTNNEFWWDELESIFLDNDRLPDSLIYEGREYSLKTVEEKKSCCRSFRLSMMDMNADSRQKQIERLRKSISVSNKQRIEYRTMNEEELCEISNIGCITIGAHTKSHCRLSSLDELGMHDEIMGSKIRLENILGKKVTTFSYPFGNDKDYTDATIREVEKCGFEKAAAVKGGLYLSGENRYEIPRNNIPGGTDLETLKKMLRKHWYEYSK